MLSKTKQRVFRGKVGATQLCCAMICVHVLKRHRSVPPLDLIYRKRQDLRECYIGRHYTSISRSAIIFTFSQGEQRLSPYRPQAVYRGHDLKLSDDGDL